MAKPTSNASEVLLDQSSIDQLMAEAKQQEEKIIVYDYKGNRIDHKMKKGAVESYDFRNPAFLTEIELRQIRIRHEKFIHYLAARLSMFLRMDFELKLSKLYTIPYGKFTEAIPNPIYISLFKIDPLAGIGVIDISPRLALTIVNRMLGGQGHSVHEERYLTEIEIALMDDVIRIFLDEWVRQWDEIREKELNISLAGNENNGRFLQTAPHDSIILVFDLQATLGDCSEIIQMGVPYYMIEPLIKEMQSNSRKYTKMGSEAKQAKWLNSYSEIQVPVIAEWDCFKISVLDLLNLKPGDVLSIPKDIVQKTYLRFEGNTQFMGEVGLESEKIAVKITEKLQQNE